MTVKAILSRKGRDVVTIEPTANLADAVKLLAERRIGALVVTGADDRVVGILSERDIVRDARRARRRRARRHVAGGDDAQGHDLQPRPTRSRSIMERMTDRQIPPSAGGRAGPARRHHLDRRRGEASRSRRSSASPTRCATTSRRRDRRTYLTAGVTGAGAAPARRSPRRAFERALGRFGAERRSLPARGGNRTSRCGRGAG